MSDENFKQSPTIQLPFNILFNLVPRAIVEWLWVRDCILFKRGQQCWMIIGPTRSNVLYIYRNLFGFLLYWHFSLSPTLRFTLCCSRNFFPSILPPVTPSSLHIFGSPYEIRIDLVLHRTLNLPWTGAPLREGGVQNMIKTLFNHATSSMIFTSGVTPLY